jgi:Na+-transporting NADH:ubiquinone oxidoreductase subunit C
MKNSFKFTLFISLVICLVSSLAVSLSVSLLKERQQVELEKDKKKNILFAASLYTPGMDVLEFFKNFVEKVYCHLDEKKIVEQESKEEIFIQKDLAKIYKRPSVVEVYVLKKYKLIIFPIYGKGLWSTMYGFLSVKEDMESIEGISFYAHGETPGLGGEIENKQWQSSWKGKKLYQDNKIVLEVVKHRAEKDYEIDALSGATITTKGVENMVKYWFDLYQPLLQQLKEKL